MHKKSQITMTEGPLLGNILLFSLPLMATNILQLLFNAVDVMIVGQFGNSYTSLAAVGSTVSTIQLLITVLIGLSVGVNVVVARHLGQASGSERISVAIHTAITIALVGGLLFSVFGIAVSSPILNLIGIPDDVRPLALQYLRIYLLGVPFLALYNYGAAVMRATGDTKRPFQYLTISGVTNVLLNLFFVVQLGWDVVGVATATVISQMLSATLILRHLSRQTDALHFSWRKLCCDREMFRQMARIGIPAGLQGCLFSLSNVVIQSAINSYDSVIMAGTSAAESIEGMMYISMNAFHQACQTFISQNLGARKFERISPIMRTCILCVITVGIAQSVLVVCNAELLISAYSNELAVMTAGAMRLCTVASLYTIFGVCDVLVGGMRGCGISMAPMLINLVGTCGFRLVWISWLDTSTMGVEWVYYSYPITWTIVLISLTIFWQYLRKTGKIFSN